MKIFILQTSTETLNTMKKVPSTSNSKNIIHIIRATAFSSDTENSPKGEEITSGLVVKINK